MEKEFTNFSKVRPGPSRRQNYSSVVFSVNCSMSPKMLPQVELTAIRADVTFSQPAGGRECFVRLKRR